MKLPGAELLPRVVMSQKVETDSWDVHKVSTRREYEDKK